MAFDISGLNCIGVGPTKLYIYTTTDTLTSGVVEVSAFNTASCPGMNAGDIIMIAHNNTSGLALIRLNMIASTSCSFTSYSDLQ